MDAGGAFAVGVVAALAPGAALAAPLEASPAVGTGRLISPVGEVHAAKTGSVSARRMGVERMPEQVAAPRDTVTAPAQLGRLGRTSQESWVWAE